MSLDFHIAKSERAASKQHAALSVEFDLHEAFLSASKRCSLKLCSRMSDYYNDAHFNAAEIPHLRSEFGVVLESVPPGELRDWVQALRNLCDKAIATDSELFVFSD